MDARKAITVFLLLTIWSTIAESQELNTILMESTFRIHGPAKTDPKNKIFFGTAFVVARPIPTSPGRGYAVMVTAAHVLDGIAGDEAILLLREKQADNIFKAHPFRLKIRNEGKDLFVRHQDADVAAMYISVPEVAKFSPVTVNYFANDDIFESLEIHPGDELHCLGFPLGAAANDIGFSILRGGKIDIMKAFLYHVLNHLIVDEYRKHKAVSLDTLVEAGFEPSVDHSEQLLNKLDGKAAMLLLNRLPQTYRKVMRMRYVQDLSLKEMSLLTGQTKNALAVQLHRDLAKLKQLYHHK